MKCLLNNAYTVVLWEVKKTFLDSEFPQATDRCGEMVVSGLKCVYRCLLLFMKPERKSFANFLRTARFDMQRKTTFQSRHTLLT